MSPLYMSPGSWIAHLIPVEKFADANYIFHLITLGWLGFFFLRDLTRRRLPAILGAVFLMLQPRVFSHLLPGHLGYFQLIGWLPGAFWFLRKAVRNGHWAHWGLAGGFLGAALANGGQDVALFFVLLLGAYGVFLLVRQARSIAMGSPDMWPESARLRPARVEPTRATGYSDTDTALTGNPAGRPDGWSQFAVRTVTGIILAGGITFLLSYQTLGAALVQARQPAAAGRAIEASDPVAPTPDETAAATREQWYWATQWSVPIEETLEFGIPGLFGWGSSDRENPYRGRIGQTEGYAEHGQGMPNLNDVSTYMGAVMLLAAWLALVLRRRDGEVWFWFLAAVIACLLAYGKHAPFYRFFYTLPYMNTMRNPIKWLYVTSFCVGILGTLGLAEIFRRSESAAETPRGGRLILILAVPGLLFVLGGAIYLMTRSNNPDALMFWQIPELRRLSARAVMLATVFWAAAAALYYWLVRAADRSSQQSTHKKDVPALNVAELACLPRQEADRRRQGPKSAVAGQTDLRHPKKHGKPNRHTPAVPANNPVWSTAMRLNLPTLLLFAILLLELLYVNVHYRPYYRTDTRIDGGAVADLFEAETTPFRIRIMGRHPALQYIGQVLAPHYGWEQADLPTARTLDDFHRLQQAIGNDYQRFLQLTNVRYLILPDQVNDPMLQPALTLQSGDQPVIIYRFRGELPRYYLVPRWRRVPHADRFSALADRRFDPAREALIHVADGEVPPPPEPVATQLDCDIIETSWHRIRLRIRCDAPAMLVGLDRHDPAWRAFVGGIQAPLWQANGMLRAIPVPAGEHEVELRLVGDGYRPLMVVGFGWLSVLTCGLVLVWRRR